MLSRAQIDGGANYIRAAVPGDVVMSQAQLTSITTVGAGTLSAAAMSNGIVERTGPVGAFIDTLDTADNLMAANPGVAKGDTFEFLYRNTVAFAATIAVAEGAELSGANTAVVASNARRYLATILATNRRQIFTVATTNASPTVTGLTAAQAQLLQPGMGVTGTGAPAAGTILAVNAVTGTITLSGNATATGTPSFTFFPRYNVKGLLSAAL